MFVLGIIAARGGSKGVPKKNIRALAGRPVISYSIERAKVSSLITRTIVSTDDQEIAAVARRFGGDVPFLRPVQLARDDSPMTDALRHAVEWMESEGGVSRVDLIVCMQPTSVFGTGGDLDRAIELTMEGDCDAVLSVCEVDYTPYYMKRIVNGRLVPLLPDDNPKRPLQRRQDAPPVYRSNGIVSVTKRHVLMEQGLRYGLNTVPMIMNFESSVNIDHESDFVLAEYFLNKKGCVSG